MLDPAAIAARGTFTEHRGARMLVVDASGLSEIADIEAMVRHIEPLIRAEPAGSVRIVMQVTGLRFSRQSTAVIKGVFVRVQPWIRASCLVGVTGLHRVLLQVLNQVARRERPLFDTLPDALDWLATQA